MNGINMRRFSEYVSLGHPDKIADYISQTVLDEFIRQDSNTRYAVEVQIKDNIVTLGGEVDSQADVDIYKCVRGAVEDIGYNNGYKKTWLDNAISGDELVINSYISQQSNDIAIGLRGWGDQGIFFGYHNNKYNGDTFEHYTAKELGLALFKSGLGGLDIKTQIVTMSGKISKVIVAIPLMGGSSEVEAFVKDNIKGDYELIINGTGRYIKHSSIADCGTTGRKLVVDFYGNGCQIGGGSPWTKDGSKADLTLNLFAKDIAKQWSEKIDGEVFSSIACCIGSRVIDITVQDSNRKILETKTLAVSPDDLIERYNLNTPIYADLCRYGLFSNLK
jgi:S-adenosylmethionine synthetase